MNSGTENKGVLLVVDDEVDLRDAICEILKPLAKEVRTAGNGKEALKHVKSGEIDAVLTDINMPQMGGIEFIGKARALAGYRFTPILVLSTESQAARRDEARRLGASGWMVKPVAGADLLKIVKQVLPGA